MSSRRLVGAAVVAASLLTLTACKAGSSPGPSTTTPAASPNSASATPTPSAVGSTSAGSSAAGSTSAGSSTDGGPPVDPEPTFDCGESKPPAGHKMVQVTAPPSSGSLQAQSTKFSCDPNGGSYVGSGPAAHYRLAAGVVAQLNAGSTEHRTVTVSVLSQHISACLKHASVPAPFTCSGNVYDITVSPSGEISRISELWHS